MTPRANGKRWKRNHNERGKAGEKGQRRGRRDEGERKRSGGRLDVLDAGVKEKRVGSARSEKPEWRSKRGREERERRV